VLCIEVDTKGDLARCLGAQPPGFAAKVVQPNISTLQLIPEDALEEYLRIYFKVPRLARMTPLGRVFDFVATGVPGAKDMLIVGKIAYEEKRVEHGRPVWDLIIVDSAATGHVLPQLQAARAMMELTRGGIIRSQVEWIDATLTDSRRTLLTICAIPEEMPVVEALELHDRARVETHVAIGACFLNRVFPAPLSARQVAVLDRLARPAHAAEVTERLGGGLPAFLDGARLAERLTEAGVQQARRLRAGMSVPVVEIPLQVGARPGLLTTRAVATALAEAAT
jgi:anion-transporting  ArsA/GET3 family ATPase